MAARYNFAAERAEDVHVVPTRAQRDTSWEHVQEVPVNAWLHGGVIDDTPPKRRPRIIRVELDWKDAMLKEANSATWQLDLNDVASLAENSVLYWRSIASNQADTCDWALSGISTCTCHVSGPPYALQARFVSAGAGTHSWVPSGATAVPLCVTMTERDVFRNRRLTVHRLGAAGVDLTAVAGLFLRVELLIVEPGARP
jgi:hypothetical protein